MKTILLSALAMGLLLSFNCSAAAPAGAPAGSTGLCNDGTYYSGPEKKGACRGHKGVKDWWGEAAAETKGSAESGVKGGAKSESKGAAKSEAKAETKAETKEPATKAAAPAPTAKPAASAKAEAVKPAAAPAPGGGADKVWANESTKVYHCPGDRWYGKTKQGEYMTEADAKAKGLKPDHGKACK